MSDEFCSDFGSYLALQLLELNSLLELVADLPESTELVVDLCDLGSISTRP